jgi:flagellar assembly factor FliW
MPVIETKNFGKISFEPESELEFPCGLPGFEERRRFVAVTFAKSEPLVYLQSLEDQDLCFITMPILAVDPRYRLTVSAEDLEQVGLPTTRQPRIGKDVFCLTVLSIRETGPTANLLAPLVVNLRTRKAVQAVAQEAGYSHQHALLSSDTEQAAVTGEVCVCS